MQPTAQQDEALRRLADFLTDHGDNGSRCFVLKGYAGTGKTTIISALVAALPALRMRSVLLAPTGRAAKVMSSYAQKKAFTVHKKIYRKKVALSPDMVFALADNPHTDTLFIIDEASMISNERHTFNGRSLLEDLIQYVANGERCRLLFVGDTAQLPPVGLLQSPALDAPGLSRRFGLQASVYELTDVVRQEKDSGILHNATAIRQQIQATAGETNEEPITFPQFTVKGYTDIYRMTGEHLIEGLHYAYDKYGMENT